MSAHENFALPMTLSERMPFWFKTSMYRHSASGLSDSNSKVSFQIAHFPPFLQVFVVAFEFFREVVQSVAYGSCFVIHSVDVKYLASWTFTMNLTVAIVAVGNS